MRRVLVQSPNPATNLNTNIFLTEVRHGSMLHEGKTHPCTLIILEIRFFSKDTSSRYKSVDVTLTFADKKGRGPKTPEVVRLTPDKMYHLNKTVIGRRYGWTVNAEPLKVGMEGMVSASIGAQWNLTEDRPKEYMATLTGAARCSGQSGPRNCVQWTMKENAQLAQGVPTFLQAGVLLKRASTSDLFTCQVQVDSTVDFMLKLWRVVDRRTDVDKEIDLIILDPKGEPLLNNEVTGIGVADLKGMERFPFKNYLKVNFAENDGRDGSAAGGYLAVPMPVASPAEVAT